MKIKKLTLIALVAMLFVGNAFCMNIPKKSKKLITADAIFNMGFEKELKNDPLYLEKTVEKYYNDAKTKFDKHAKGLWKKKKVKKYFNTLPEGFEKTMIRFFYYDKFGELIDKVDVKSFFPNVKGHYEQGGVASVGVESEREILEFLKSNLYDKLSKSLGKDFEKFINMALYFAYFKLKDPKKAFIVIDISNNNLVKLPEALLLFKRIGILSARGNKKMNKPTWLVNHLKKVTGVNESAMLLYQYQGGLDMYADRLNLNPE